MKFIFALLVLLSLVTLGFCSIGFVSPTLQNGSFTSNGNLSVNVSVSPSSLTSFTFNLSNVGYTYYDSTLVASYDFDNISSLGESDSFVSDSSLYSNNLSCSDVSCPAWSNSGHNGGAFTYDGVNDSFNDTQSSSLEIQNLSIESWVYVDPSAGVRNTIVSYGVGTGAGGPPDGSGESYALIYHTDIGSGIGTFRLRLKDFAGANVVDAYNDGSSPSAQVYGHWVHVVATWNGSTAVIYVNGNTAVTASGSGSINYVANPNTRLRIGNWFGNNERWFKGKIDDVRIYNRSLSANEAEMHYFAGLYRLGASSFNFQLPPAPLLSYGIYNYSACYSDLLPSSNCTIVNYLTVDPLPPSIELISPTNHSSFVGSTFSVPFVFNASDSLSPYLNCSVIVGNSTVANNPSSLNNFDTTIYATGLLPGQHTGFVRCVDLAGNSVNSSSIVFTGTGSSDSSSHTTPRLSVSLDMQCTNNTITTSTNSVSIKVIDDNSGASIFSGTTDSSDHALFSACGQNAHIYASKDGYAPTDSVYTLNDCTCAGTVVTNDTTISTPVPPVVPPVPTPINTTVPTPVVNTTTPAPVVNTTVPAVPSTPSVPVNPVAPTFNGPSSGQVGSSATFTVSNCDDCSISATSPDGRVVVLPVQNGQVSLPLSVAGQYSLALVRNGEVLQNLGVSATAPTPAPAESAPQTAPSDSGFGFWLMIILLLVIIGAIAYYLMGSKNRK